MTQLKQTLFTTSMEARDHECDIQGVVNNAHYQHYFEHARHQFLLKNGIDFAELAKQNINLMVSHIEISYKSSLKAHDRFYISVEAIQVSKLKVRFEQKLYLEDTQQLMAIANTTVVPVGAFSKPLKNSPLHTLFS